MQDSSVRSLKFRSRLFDSYGLPWTSSLRGYWLYILTAVTGFLFAFLLGIYLGLWLKSKGKGTSVLFMYLAIAALATPLYFLPDRLKSVEDMLFLAVLLLWFAAAYFLQRKVVSYYSEREGTSPRINPLMAGLLSVWYINSQLRADFPHNEAGKTADGILKIPVR